MINFISFIDVTTRHDLF